MKGNTEFGDNIDDEWLIVYILYEVSKRYGSRIGISVHDNDGEFLLIEAADYLPTWLGPENSENRVWIKNGKLHLIPLDEAGSKDGYICTRDALIALRREKFTMAEESVQSCLTKRISSFPEYAFASMHTTLCTLPKHIAKLLIMDPLLVSSAVSAFCSSNRDKKEIQVLSSMKKFGDYCSNGAEYVTVPVTLTRAHFAKLSFQKFHPPRKFHNAMMNLTSNGPRDLDSQKAFDLGVRIVCGFEMSFQKSSTSPGSSGMAGILDQYELDLGHIGYFGKLVKGSEEYKSKLGKAEDYLHGVFVSRSSKDMDVNEDLLALRAVHVPRPLHLIINALTTHESFQHLAVKNSDGVIPDSEDWLYMSPEDFEQEMRRRVATCEGSNTTTSMSMATSITTTSTAAADAPNMAKDHVDCADISASKDENKDTNMMNDEMAEMDKIVSNMKAFMNLGSDYEGIEPADATSKQIEKSKGSDDSPGEQPGGNIAESVDMNSFDVNKFLSILQNEVNGGSIERNEKSGGSNNHDSVKVDDIRGYFSEDDEDGEEYPESINSDEIEEFFSSSPGIDSSSTATNSTNTAVGDFINLLDSSTTLGVGSFMLNSEDEKKCPNEKGRGEKEQIVDSDDEGEILNEEDDYADFDNPEFMQNYIAALDAELGESTLIDTFEKTDAAAGGEDREEEGKHDGEIDLDLTVIKNLLESHSLQIGGAGPASALLAQMGLKFPRSEVRGEEDEEGDEEEKGRPSSSE